MKFPCRSGWGATHADAVRTFGQVMESSTGNVTSIDRDSRRFALDAVRARDAEHRQRLRRLRGGESPAISQQSAEQSSAGRDSAGNNLGQHGGAASVSFARDPPSVMGSDGNNNSIGHSGHGNGNSGGGGGNPNK